MPEAFSLEITLRQNRTLLYFVPDLLFFLSKFVFLLWFSFSFCLPSLPVFSAGSMDPNVNFQ
jgi:hypothetical protein